MRTKIVAGNWKMNLTLEQAQTLASEVVHIYASETPQKVKVILAPPYPFLTAVHHLIKHNAQFSVAAQNLHPDEKGAFTGEVSAGMLCSVGTSHVLIGHSERRQYNGETNATVAARINRALGSGLAPIVCVGETRQQRESGQTFSLLASQLSEGTFHLPADEFGKIILAYEPVWAIGTGLTASPEQAQEVHAFLRGKIAAQYGSAVAENCPILYGGSVTAANSACLFSQSDIDGGLVGGASLKSREFADIILRAGEIN